MIYLERVSKAGLENGESTYYIYRGTDTDMPNCTRYAHGRAREACWDDTLEPARPSGGFPNAKYWYNTTSLPKGTELREGAIAVFDGSCGHVAFVERVIDSTHAIVTQSNYNANKKLRNWYFWERKTYELVVGKPIGGTGNLLGFIYCPIDDKRVARDTNKDQVEVTGELVNVRQEPSTSAAKYAGRACPLGIFDVLEWKDADGYTWAKLDENAWIACGGWTTIHKQQKSSEVEKLQKQIDALQAKLDKIKEIVA